VQTLSSTSPSAPPPAAADPAWVRRLLVSVTCGFLGLFLAVPIAAVFGGALAEGWATLAAAVVNPEAAAAIRLTLTVVAIVLPLNLLFGVAAALTIARHQFPGRQLLITLIDLPFAVSPVVSGLVFVLLFGVHGAAGAWLEAHGIRVIFAVPGIVLATLFVTVPFVARELIPLMAEQGVDEELAAMGLGAGFWRTFFSVTLPKIRWGLIYGVILLTARAIGEFGAVSVVSGHIRGETITAPLHIEILYNEYNFAAAFAVAALLTLIAFATVAATALIEWKSAASVPSRTAPTEAS
jgi:sulfate/thiosulfate transport system permease protein